MTASQSLQIYDNTKTNSFEKILNKYMENLRQEMYKVFLTKEDKVDIIKWMVGMWVAQMAAIVFIIIRK